jgi:hypothetical protein
MAQLGALWSASVEVKFVAVHDRPLCGKEEFMSSQTVPEFHLLYPEWQVEYTQALLELDPSKLPDLLSAAEAVISKRVQALSGAANHQQERQALQDALHNLQVLRQHGGA